MLLLISLARFRARPGAGHPKPVHGHTALEIGWTLAPALILVFIAVPTMREIFATAGQAPDGAWRVGVIRPPGGWGNRYPPPYTNAPKPPPIPARTPIPTSI